MALPATYPWEQLVCETERRFFLDFAYEELAALITGWGHNEANARLIFSGLHRSGYRHWQEFPAKRLARKVLARLTAEDAPRLAVFKEVRDFPSSDGSVKYLYTLHDGQQVESVHMPFRKRHTFCISSQVGCALGCTFCATGAMGFKRHLSPGEIVGQVLHMRRMSPDPAGFKRRANVVFMGMGEPLHNLDNVMKVFHILTHPMGLHLSERDVAVSTAGLVPKIRKLATFERRPSLMVSIGATVNSARSAIMPVNRAHALEELFSTLAAYPLRKKERIMLSYVVIAGVNDSDQDAARLIDMSRRFPSLVNLIPMNEHAASPAMLEPTESSLRHFYKTLCDAGVFATIRRSRGRDIGGACGQLTTQAASTPVDS